jgi:hypothetical protein
LTVTVPGVIAQGIAIVVSHYDQRAAVIDHCFYHFQGAKIFFPPVDQVAHENSCPFGVTKISNLALYHVPQFFQKRLKGLGMAVNIANNIVVSVMSHDEYIIPLKYLLMQ